MRDLRRCLMLVGCLTGLMTNAAGQEPANTPSVVLRGIPPQILSYPRVAEGAIVSGKVEVRVGVRPDGSVAEVTVLPRDNSPALLEGAVVTAASGASFDCRGCTAPSTPHTMVFVFSLDGYDNAGNRLPTAWRQTGDASSEVTVFGDRPLIGGGPPRKPIRVRAARCLWLWHCSKEMYGTMQ